ncbi:hypothetical protein [uncultured Oscillibacter sp.]|uniref:hypothetical protein n=1 Tax=uncultured Oscillibacter sp. TaxID=876091 RepID=UPI0025F6970C|nr:hypothetical protein [uncultured Oscillibacter sp.]
MVQLLQEAFYLGGSVALVWLVLLPAVILLVVSAVYILAETFHNYWKRRGWF